MYAEVLYLWDLSQNETLNKYEDCLEEQEKLLHQVLKKENREEKKRKAQFKKK